MTEALFGELRSLLQQPMSEHTWTRITLLLDVFPDDDELEQLIAPYLLAHFDRLPTIIARRAPHSWYDASHSDARKRAYASLTGIPCPKCGDLCNQTEVTGALKARYGKRYTKIVRTRDVMTGDRAAQHTAWECARCRREAVDCPRCARDMSFVEVLGAMRRIYGDEANARQMARRVLDEEMNPSEWACEACYELAPPEDESASTDSIRRPRTHAGYADVQSRCKVCRADFIFTAQEQFMWYERYGIPFGIEGMWGHVDRVVRVRCDACQRVHVAQKRIGQLLPASPDDERAHRALMHHYMTLGNIQKANMHRNILKKLEEP